MYYQFMLSIGFVYEDQISYYQDTQDGEEIVMMRND